jgi:hypothetical protein
MFFPALLFIAVVGWFMYSVDNQNPTLRKQTNRRTVEKDYVTLLPIDFEEQRQIRTINAV